MAATVAAAKPSILGKRKRSTSSLSLGVKRSIKQVLPSEPVATLRRLSSQAARQAFAAATGARSEEVTSRQARVARLADRFQGSCSKDDGEEDNCGLKLSETTARLLTEVAQCSAVVAASSVCRDGEKSCIQVGTQDAVRAQCQLDRKLEALRHERELSASLVKRLGSLCWHSAWAAARKSLLSRGNAPGVWKSEELQRRLNDIRAELAAEKGQDDLPVAKQQGWRGVNLGGWLLWEPGPCNQQPLVKATGHVPPDEWTLCADLRAKFGPAEAARLVAQHRAEYITKKDFEEIAALGMNSVRLPFGYWVVVGPRPGEPYIGPCLEALDNAFKWAEETGLQIVLSFHGTIGCQSNHQASGRSSDDWEPRMWDPHASLEVLRRVSARYGRRQSLGGITVVNEPSCHLPLDRLQRYYKNSYRAIRRSGVPDRVQVIFPVYQRWFRDFKGMFEAKQGYRNVVFDVHVYHLFSPQWFRMSLASHLRWAAAQGRWHDAKEISRCGERVIVSEWCMALPTWDWRNLVAWEWYHLTRAEKNEVLRSFGRRQLRTFASHSEGWFFWSWKDEDGVQWNMRETVARGYLTLKSPSSVPASSPQNLPPRPGSSGKSSGNSAYNAVSETSYSAEGSSTNTRSLTSEAPASKQTSAGRAHVSSPNKSVRADTCFSSKSTSTMTPQRPSRRRILLSPKSAADAMKSMTTPPKTTEKSSEICETPKVPLKKVVPQKRSWRK